MNVGKEIKEEFPESSSTGDRAELIKEETTKCSPENILKHEPYDTEELLIESKDCIDKLTKLEEDDQQRVPGHCKKRSVKCTKCDYTAKQIHILRQHIVNKHTPANFQWICCELCSYRAKYRTNLRLHVLRKHTSKDSVKLLKCNQCCYKTKIKNDLNKHLAAAHSTSRDFKCLFCDKTYKSGQCLKRHIELKHDPDEWVQKALADASVKDVI